MIHWLGLPALLAEELTPPHQHYRLSETKHPIQKAALRALGPQVVAVVVTTAIESEAAR